MNKIQFIPRHSISLSFRLKRLNNWKPVRCAPISRAISESSLIVTSRCTRPRVFGSFCLLPSIVLSLRGYDRRRKGGRIGAYLRPVGVVGRRVAHQLVLLPCPQ